MIYNAIKYLVGFLRKCSVNALAIRVTERVSEKPQAGAYVSEGILLVRVLFAILAAVLFPKCWLVVSVLTYIQITSLAYVFHIVLDDMSRQKVKDARRSIVFALLHYVELMLSFAYLWHHYGEFSTGALSRIDSVYFSLVTITTLGYGDIHPAGVFTKLMAGTEALLGVGMLVIFVGLFLSLSTAKRNQSQQEPERDK